MKAFKEKSTGIQGKWVTSYSDDTRYPNGRLSYFIKIDDVEFKPSEILKLQKVLETHMERIQRHKGMSK